MEDNKNVFLVLNDSDNINFKTYIDAVKKNKITWDLFIQLMQDLSTNMNRQKLLISILLQEFKTLINTHQCQQCQLKGKSENFQCIPTNTTIKDSVIQKSNLQNYKPGIIISEKDEDESNFEDNSINESMQSAKLESSLIMDDPFNTKEEIECEVPQIDNVSVWNAKDLTVSSTSLEYLEKFENKSQQEGTCNKQNNDIGNLEKQPSKKLMCAKCPQEFAAKHYYITHYKFTHGGGNELPPGFENLMQFKCDQCPKSFSITSSLKRHIQIKHLAESTEIDQSLVSKRLKLGRPKRIHQCKLCLKTFISAYLLVDHIKRDHEGRKDYKCHICSKEFGWRDVLKKHIKRHEKIKDFVCETCGKAYIFKHELSEHVKKHLCS